MTGDSTSKGPTCDRCGLEIGGSSIWEGSLPYHPNCAPSAINVGGNLTEDQIMAAAGMVWEADVIARLSKALGMTGPVTLGGLLSETEERLREHGEGREDGQ